MIFSIENNNYGLSTPSDLQTPCGDITATCPAFKFIDHRRRCTDPELAWQAVCQAFDMPRWRRTVLLQFHVVRLTGTPSSTTNHTKLYERVAEIERDPVERFGHTWQRRTMQRLVEEVQAELATAQAEAEASPEPDPASALCLFFEGQSPIQADCARKCQPAAGSDTPHSTGPRINLIDAVRQTLEAEMTRNPRLLVLARTWAQRRRAWPTRDMQTHLVQSGSSIPRYRGGHYRPRGGHGALRFAAVPEIQFRKYADPAYEQIDDLGTLRWRTANASPRR